MCGKSRDYSSKRNYNRALKNNICNGCSRKGKKRSAEQRLRISIATKQAMKSPLVRDMIKSSMNHPTIKKRMSDNGLRQMYEMLKTDEDKQKWTWKISESTKLKWNSRPISEKEKILEQIANGRSRFRQLMSDISYKKEHVRKCLCTGKTKNTKPEREFKTILSIMNIQYIQQYQIEDKVFDFYIPQLNLLIEIDGTYWHGKNLTESDMNAMQLKHKRNDTYKNNMAKQLNYNLERFWEDEINENNVTERIFKYVK